MGVEVRPSDQILYESSYRRYKRFIGLKISLVLCLGRKLYSKFGYYPFEKAFSVPSIIFS